MVLKRLTILGLGLALSLTTVEADNLQFSPLSSSTALISSGQKGLALGDYDGDGLKDLVVCNGVTATFPAQAITKIYHNDGGTFRDIGANIEGRLAGTCTWVDIDNDGDLDLYITGADSAGTIKSSKLYQNDNGVFTYYPFAPTPSGISVAYSSVVFGDTNGDGRQDMLISGYTGTTAQGAPKYLGELYESRLVDGVWRYYQNSELPYGTFGPAGWSSNLIYDFDNDGKNDVLISGQSWQSNENRSTIYAWRNLGGTGTFHYTLLSSAGQQYNVSDIFPSVDRGSFEVGDVNGDGFPEILITGHNNVYGSGSPDEKDVAKLFKNTNGVFSEVNLNLPGVQGGAGKFIDINSDGKLDIVLASPTGSKIYINQGNYSFTLSSAALPNATDVVGLDANGDGLTDLIFAPNSSSEATRIQLQLHPVDLSGLVQTTSSSGVSALDDVQFTITLSGDASGSTTPNQSGEYKFNSVRAGNYVIKPSRNGYRFTPEERLYAVDGLNNATGLDFQATRIIVPTPTPTPTPGNGGGSNPTNPSNPSNPSNPGEQPTATPTPVVTPEPTTEAPDFAFDVNRLSSRRSKTVKIPFYTDADESVDRVKVTLEIKRGSKTIKKLEKFVAIDHSEEETDPSPEYFDVKPSSAGLKKGIYKILGYASDDSGQKSDGDFVSLVVK